MEREQEQGARPVVASDGQEPAHFVRLVPVEAGLRNDDIRQFWHTGEVPPLHREPE
jgi:hypothetical protein